MNPEENNQPQDQNSQNFQPNNQPLNQAQPQVQQSTPQPPVQNFNQRQPAQVGGVDYQQTQPPVAGSSVGMQTPDYNQKPKSNKKVLIAVLVGLFLFLVVISALLYFLVFNSNNDDEFSQAVNDSSSNSEEVAEEITYSISTPCYSFEVPEKWSEGYSEDETCSITTKDFELKIIQHHTDDVNNHMSGTNKDFTNLDTFADSDFRFSDPKPKKTNIKLGGQDAIRVDDVKGSGENAYTITSIYTITTKKGYKSSSGSVFNGIEINLMYTHEPENEQYAQQMIDTWTWK